VPKTLLTTTLYYS